MGLSFGPTVVLVIASLTLRDPVNSYTVTREFVNTPWSHEFIHTTWLVISYTIRDSWIRIHSVTRGDYWMSFDVSRANTFGWFWMDQWTHCGLKTLILSWTTTKPWRWPMVTVYPWPPTARLYSNRIMWTTPPLLLCLGTVGNSDKFAVKSCLINKIQLKTTRLIITSWKFCGFLKLLIIKKNQIFIILAVLRWSCPILFIINNLFLRKQFVGVW